MKIARYAAHQSFLLCGDQAVKLFITHLQFSSKKETHGMVQPLTALRLCMPQISDELLLHSEKSPGWVLRPSRRDVLLGEGDVRSLNRVHLRQSTEYRIDSRSQQSCATTTASRVTGQSRRCSHRRSDPIMTRQTAGQPLGMRAWQTLGKWRLVLDEERRNRF